MLRRAGANHKLTVLTDKQFSWSERCFAYFCIFSKVGRTAGICAKKCHGWQNTGELLG
jgi:hypothetical protein